MKQLQETLNNFFKITHLNKDNLDQLYKSLITEEFNEFMQEPERSPNQFKELCDLIWVSIQFANAQGYDLEKGMQALCEEYKSKLYNDKGELSPQYNDNGKLLKGKYFKKADFTKLV